MSSTAITTMVKMLENLPVSTQNQVVEHLRELLAELDDEQLWDEQFAKTEKQLVAAARQAGHEIAAGHAETMDFDRL
jgi:hypothetical protein